MQFKQLNRKKPTYKAKDKQVYILRIFILKDGKREQLSVRGIPSDRPTSLEQMRSDIRGYTKADLVHITHEER